MISRVFFLSILDKCKRMFYYKEKNKCLELKLMWTGGKHGISGKNDVDG